MLRPPVGSARQTKVHLQKINFKLIYPTLLIFINHLNDNADNKPRRLICRKTI